VCRESQVSRVSKSKSFKVPNVSNSSNPALGGSTGSLFWGGSGYGPGEDAWDSIRAGEWHVDVFEDGLGGDAFYTVRGLDEVVARTAGLFAA
jgi:hypothetical protein